VIRRARDSLRARVGGPWSQEKLTYVQRYATAFMNSMMPKRRSGLWSELVYLDFLAGPGVRIDRRTGIEFPGSPLRALQVMPPFDRLVFSDVDARNVDTHLLFFSKHPTGLALWRGVTRIEPSGQRQLF
jgi:hypothetical protein